MSQQMADFLLSFDPETIDSPYLPNINLKSLREKKRIAELPLVPTMSDDEARVYEGTALKTFKYEKLSESTVGLKQDKVVFLYLKSLDFLSGDLISPGEIALATEGLGELKWDQADNSNRKCLRGTHGRELHFGWCDGFGKIRVYVPTVDQTLSWMKLWPLIDKIEGIYARTMPQIWGDANLAKQMAEGFKHCVEGEKGRSTFGAVQLLKNAPSKVHLDPGNHKRSMTALTTCGDFEGGDFLLLQYGIGIHVQPGDVLIARTHEEWHCNVGEVKGTRYSIIAYAREPKS